MSSEDTASKTEQATPERRKKAREEGQFARARDAGGVAATAGALLVLAAGGPYFGQSLQRFAMWCFRAGGDVAHNDIRVALGRTLTTLATLALPSAIAAAIGAVAIGFAQAGFQPRLELAGFRWNRLDPIGKLKTMFVSPDAFIELMIALVRVGVVGYVAWASVRDALPVLSALSRASLLSSVAELWSATGQLTLRCCIALTVLATGDYVLSRLRVERQMRMSRREIKEEMKQQEGDPQIRARQRARAREMLKRSLGKEVRNSDVVVTNPTHVAVALRYRRSLVAPIVTAKGYDDVAMVIRQIAKEAGIPIVENRPLARELARRVRPGRQIPADLFAAVAEVLAFVYRLRNQFFA